MSLRNEIEKIQLDLVEKTANPTTKWEDVIPEATSQILSLLEGSLPKEKSIEIPSQYGLKMTERVEGWNACLQEIKDSLHEQKK